MMPLSLRLGRHDRRDLPEARSIPRQSSDTGRSPMHQSLLPEKFQLTHFTRARTRHDVDQVHPHHVVPHRTFNQPASTLAVTMDTKLQWKAHVEGNPTQGEQNGERARRARKLKVGRQHARDLRKIYLRCCCATDDVWVLDMVERKR